MLLNFELKHDNKYKIGKKMRQTVMWIIKNLSIKSLIQEL